MFNILRIDMLLLVIFGCFYRSHERSDIIKTSEHGTEVRNVG